MSRLVWAGALALMLMPVAGWSAYPGALPAEADVLRAIANAPQVQAARWQQDVASAQRRRLAAGPYEWEAGATQQRRTDPSGINYSEQTYEVSRALRWFGKASLDRALGAQAVTVGELSFADTWHEAARALLAGWFEWLRATRRVQVLSQQLELLRQELASVETRVRAGDARAVDRTLAETELARAGADLTAAELQVHDAELALRRSFPDLELTAPNFVASPLAPGGADEEWIHDMVADNHELELARAEQGQAQLAARRAGRERVPDPKVGVRYSHNFDGNHRVIGVNVTIPLGGPARSAAFAESLAQARIAEEHTRATQLKVQSDAERAVVAARSAHARWQQLRAAADQAQASAETLQRGYSLGEFTITELLLGRRQALDAQLQATSAQLDALEAAGRLELDAHHIWVPPGDH